MAVRKALLQYADDDLLALIARDEIDAFTAIYRRYWEPLLVTAARAIRCKTEAADIVQDVFLSLWNRRAELDIQGSLAAYLQTSVRYKAIHYIEKNIVRHDYISLLTDASGDTLSESGEIGLQVKQVQELIRHTVSRMPSKMQTVYKLSRQENLSHKEIAAQLGISTETVKKHIRHALSLVRSALEQSSVSVPLLILTLLD